MNIPKMKHQKGYLLIEALAGVLIFSIGILGVVGIYSEMFIRNQDAGFRINATLMADEYLSMIIADNSNKDCYSIPANGGCASQFATNYVNNWTNDINARFPGANDNAPTVVIDGNDQVTISIFWQRPGEAAMHNHIIVSQI